jgi:hypothetical protein
MFDAITMIDFSRSLAHRAEVRKHAGPYTWTPATPGGSRGFYMDRKAVRMHREAPFDLRLAYADDFMPRYSRLHGTTYCTDDDGIGDTMRPIIARLPHGRGFLAGWTLGPGMCGALDLTIHATAEDAARMAHEEARTAAERERDYQREERARLEAEELAEEERAALGTEE